VDTQGAEASAFFSGGVSDADALGREDASVDAADDNGFAHVAAADDDEVRMCGSRTRHMASIGACRRGAKNKPEPPCGEALVI
jgi:hypothetical protein